MVLLVILIDSLATSIEQRAAIRKKAPIAASKTVVGPLTPNTWIAEIANFQVFTVYHLSIIYLDRN